MDRNERIRQRAHEIWESEGRPEGRDAEHWSRAEQEIDEQMGQAGSASADADELMEARPDQIDAVAAAKPAAAKPAAAKKPRKRTPKAAATVDSETA